jgi:hypothetical protein
MEPMDFDVPDMQNHLIQSMAQWLDIMETVVMDGDENNHLEQRLAATIERLEDDECPDEDIMAIKGKLAEACEMLWMYLNKENT